MSRVLIAGVLALTLDELLDEDWGQRLLVDLKPLDVTVECLCKAPHPRLKIWFSGGKKRKAFLRRLSGDGSAHAVGGPRYEQPGLGLNRRPLRGTAAVAIEDGMGQRLRISPPPGLLKDDSEGRRRPRRRRKRQQTPTHGTNLGGLIRWTLQQGKWNEWFTGRDRSESIQSLISNVAWRLSETKITDGPLEGRLLAPRLSNEWECDRAIKSVRQTVGCKSRKFLMLIGEINSVDEEWQEEVLVGVEDLWRVAHVPKALWERRKKRADYPAIHKVLARVRNQQDDSRLLIIGWAEVLADNCLRLVDLSLIVLSRHLLPVQSEHECQLANALHGAGLWVTKPLRAVEGEDFCHDFVIELSDGRKAIIEVKGRNDPKYNRAFERKRKYLEEKFPGLHLIWDAAAGEPMPDVIAWLKSL
jgi:hypothetical protein